MKLPRPLRAPATITRRPVSAFAGCYVHEAIGLALLPGSVPRGSRMTCGTCGAWPTSPGPSSSTS
ncbi:Integrase OS=Streptomyces microflavus OX=1919 GN=Smic_07850 PE=4 SV=1 [Streptomyces microflavus]